MLAHLTFPCCSAPVTVCNLAVPWFGTAAGARAFVLFSSPFYFRLAKAAAICRVNGSGWGVSAPGSDGWGGLSLDFSLLDFSLLVWGTRCHGAILGPQTW